MKLRAISRREPGEACGAIVSTVSWLIEDKFIAQTLPGCECQLAKTRRNGEACSVTLVLVNSRLLGQWPVHVCLPGFADARPAIGRYTHPQIQLAIP